MLTRRGFFKAAAGLTVATAAALKGGALPAHAMATDDDGPLPPFTVPAHPYPGTIGHDPSLMTYQYRLADGERTLYGERVLLLTEQDILTMPLLERIGAFRQGLGLDRAVAHFDRAIPGSDRTVVVHYASTDALPETYWIVVQPPAYHYFGGLAGNMGPNGEIVPSAYCYCDVDPLPRGDGLVGRPLFVR